MLNLSSTFIEYNEWKLKSQNVKLPLFMCLIKCELFKEKINIENQKQMYGANPILYSWFICKIKSKVF